ncbi:MAG TPA: Lrp/AsnC ligand binding domain-containing protein [Mycobacteriales bacterium]|nr:Lrp/AsnC ligand binding domain-containing protein [Mycobacteriales bacterium]
MGNSMILLLQAETGTAATLAATISAIPAVVEATVTSGPYDVIGRVDCPDPLAERHAIEAVQRAPGLARLCLCRSVAR